MAENKQKEPVKLVDENDPSLTFLNTHVDGHDGEEGSDYLLDNQDENRFNEETASEFSADERLREDPEEEADRTDAGKGIGTLALILSITSLFLVPLLLGTAGIICGAVAISRGARGLGIWATAIGIVSVLSTLIFSPYF
ncbi:YqfX [Niallia circulans]|uniref:CD225/dispanin family protein n=1 Tax=Shouchella clausii TaxID=79880 RepID=UPI000D9A4C48|nr:CD225/dispanin family protein [Shouchella clausii]SPU21999.1 YqfX [Niallia circulans]